MLVLNLVLALAWTVLTGQYTVFNFVAGLIGGYAILWLTAHKRQGQRYFSKVPQVIGFALYFAWELALANIRVVANVLGPQRKLRPAIIAVPLDITSDAEITMLANLITLTPGTLSLDVSNDRRTLYVHAMNCDDPAAFVRETKAGFERRVREVFA